MDTKADVLAAPEERLTPEAHRRWDIKKGKQRKVDTPEASEIPKVDFVSISYETWSDSVIQGNRAKSVTFASIPEYSHEATPK